jgi:hypothetical protein
MFLFTAKLWKLCWKINYRNIKDQLDFLLEHNISAARLDSTLGREEYSKILEKAKSGRAFFHIKSDKVSLRYLCACLFETEDKEDPIFQHL